MLSVINKTQERRHSVFLLLTLNKFYIRVTEKLKKIIKQYRKSLIETRKVKRTCQSSVAFKQFLCSIDIVYLHLTDS